MLMRHTTLALAIALQLGSTAAWAADPVPALPVTPAAQTAAAPAVATPAAQAVPAVAPPAAAATPAVATPAAAAVPVAKPQTTAATPEVKSAPAKAQEAKPDVKPVVVVDAKPETPEAKQPCRAPLMNAEEREAHREKLRTLEPEARQAYMAEHRARMRQRMREAVGVADDADSRPDFNRPHPLLSDAELAAHREKMRTLKGQELEAYLDAHHAQMRERAQKQAEADETQMPPEFVAQRKRIMELQENLRREMDAYRARMREYWAEAPVEGPGPEMMGRPWPRPGWQMPGPGYGPGPWGGPEGAPYLPRGYY